MTTTLPKNSILEEIGFDGREDFQILITPPAEIISELFAKAKAVMKEEGYITDLDEKPPTEDCYGSEVSGFIIGLGGFSISTLCVPAVEHGQIPGEVSYGDSDEGDETLEKLKVLISESGIADNGYLKIDLDKVSEIGFFANKAVGLNLEDPLLDFMTG